MAAGGRPNLNGGHSFPDEEFVVNEYTIFETWFHSFTAHILLSENVQFDALGSRNFTSEKNPAQMQLLTCV